MSKVEYNNRPLSPEGQKTMYFASLGKSVAHIYDVHRKTGQLEPRRSRGQESKARSWRNLVQQGIVQVARVDELAKLLGLPKNVRDDAREGSAAHNIGKRKELEATRDANAEIAAAREANQPDDKISPLAAVKVVIEAMDGELRNAGLSDRARKYARAPRGYAHQLRAVDRIVRQWRESGEISTEDLGYLAVHYVSDLATGRYGTDWVTPGKRDESGKVVWNAVDERAKINNENTDYKQRIIHEISAELAGTRFEGMNTHEVMAILSHESEQIFAQKIAEQTGTPVDPLEIPELLDQKIKERIEQV